MKPLLSEYITWERIRVVYPYLKGNILDLGCGYTRIPPLLEPDQSYVGIDHDPKVIQWAKDHFPNHQFYRYDLETDPIKGLPQFDTLLMLAVLEHMADPGLLLRQATDWMKPTGKLVLTTPTPLGGQIHTLGSYLGFFYKEAREDHKGFYSRKMLVQTLKNHLFSVDLYRNFLWAGNQVTVCSSMKPDKPA
jgi:2-polyprenyl-3-methyl-5-hydroxy-6-metoxy-1,4-benzoquinol methylase